jgi:nitrate/TMAO reductase-like tetraheme cytochrome c subunit
MKKVRIVIAVVILGGLAAVVGLVFVPTGQSEVSASVSRMTSADCAECHREIAREVAESWHGQAYTDPDVLQLSKNFQDTQCISCHAPRPIFERGDAVVGDRVLARRENREIGIDCISCHLLPDGRVAGTRGLEDAPCRPVAKPVLKRAQFCSGCHNQHKTVDEYMASRWAETHTCNDCHMPKVDRPLAEGHPVRKGVMTHRFEGGHYLWMLKKAATLDVRVEDGKLIVSVTNSGTGHMMPSDARHRSFNLLVTVRDAKGNLLAEQVEIAEYRLYYRQMKRPSTQLAPDETRTHTYDLPEDVTGRVKVEFVYCLNPNQKLDKSWAVVETVERDF